MWITTGILAFIGFTGWSIYQSLGRPFRENHRQTHPVEHYYWHCVESKRPPHEHYFGLDASGLPEITIRKEGKSDRFSKWIGITLEPQTDDTEFNQHFYLMTDHLEYQQALSTSSEAREVIRILFEKTGIIHLGIQHGVLFGYWKSTLGKSPNEICTLSLDELLDLLQRLRNALQQSLKERPFQLHPSVVKAAFLMAAHGGLAITALLGFAFFFHAADDYDNRIILLGALCGFGAAIIWAMMILIFMGRTSRTHIVMINFITIGFAGWIFSAIAWITVINVEWNIHQPRYQTTTLIEKRIYSGRRTSSAYRLTFAPGVNGRGKFVIKTNRLNYESSSIGDPRMLAIYPDLLATHACWLSIRLAEYSLRKTC